MTHLLKSSKISIGTLGNFEVGLLLLFSVATLTEDKLLAVTAVAEEDEPVVVIAVGMTDVTLLV
jgi:hypothetical protein